MMAGATQHDLSAQAGTAMPKIHFITADGQTQTVEASEGQTVMEAAREAGVPGIVAECGGSALCSTCHVHIEPDWRAVVGPPSDLENMTLDLANDVDDASRLSCQIVVKSDHDGLTVRVAEHQAGY